MRTLAWILGLIALCGSLFLTFSGFTARRGVQHATAAVDKAHADLSAWKTNAELKIMNDDSAVDNDEILLHGDDLDIQIARLERRGLAQAQEKLSTDRMKLVFDQGIQRLDNLDNTLGPDRQVASAMERVQASEQSLDIYASVITRDERLAYAVGFLWLAYGFAAAMAAQQRKNEMRM